MFDGFETFLFVPNTTAKSGTHIHDSIDSKRIMSMVDVYKRQRYRYLKPLWMSLTTIPAGRFSMVLSRI